MCFCPSETGIMSKHIKFQMILRKTHIHITKGSTSTPPLFPQIPPLWFPVVHELAEMNTLKWRTGENFFYCYQQRMIFSCTFTVRFLKTDIIPACIILKFHTHGSDPSISKPLPINLLALKEYSWRWPYTGHHNFLFLLPGSSYTEFHQYLLTQYT